MVTMQQIADRCGVSRGTVDRALHHKEGVREEVAERIRATAREMGYISNRLVMQQTQQWKIGVVLHSGHSPFVQMLCELFESFSERELLPNITVIVRAMQDMDVQHQLTLIDELVTTEHIDGLALMPLANTLVRDKINTLSEQQGIPVVTFNTDITDANRIAYVGADNIASGRAAAALLGMVMQGHGSVLPILGQRSGHYADSQRFTGFSTEMAESFPDIRVLHPECSFLDESLSERIRAFTAPCTLHTAAKSCTSSFTTSPRATSKWSKTVRSISSSGRTSKHRARSRSACSTTTSSATSSPESA